MTSPSERRETGAIRSARRTRKCRRRRAVREVKRWNARARMPFAISAPIIHQGLKAGRAQLLRKIDTHELTGSGKTRGFARAVVLERRNPIFALEKSP